MEAERRQITVLFADMVGFTSYSERSGEEAAFMLMRSLSKLMDGAVRERGGIVRGFTGDGIMAVFGAPVAFEDAPLRAARAALGILQRLKEAGPHLEANHGVRPQLRIGLNTGAAVVGKVDDSADSGVTVLGDTVNFAARLQSLADPNSVFMSEATHRLVQGLVEESFAGEHIVKGKSEPQRVYRLDAVRHGATKFEAAVSRGLSTFVGRERELEVLERGFDHARSQLCVFDIVGEPGMGKSRLLHEFRQRIGKERAFILSGSCSPDGRQTPFLPFIEVVRGSFRVSAGEPEKDIAQKLEIGLSSLGLNSPRNLGLLLHLLGLKVPEGALAGLDGVLIGLRTRELLQQLLEVRCGLTPVLMVIEDLHWIDSVSEEVLGKIVDSDTKLRLLLLHTRRPEYALPWLDHTAVTKLHLEPLLAGDIRRLVQTRLGVDALPDALARQVAEKAEGNALFAEEIVSFLIERGVLRTVAGRVEFDAGMVVSALPASVQSLLSARVDRLAPKDRALLQAASVIGRRFDPELLAVVVGETDIDAQLAAMQALDLAHRESESGDYSFKHALVRDALYQSLLTGPRTALHLKIAEKIERRSDNRPMEVAEILAHHYSQTDRAEKAFSYLSLAGAKGFAVYSLDEAMIHFDNALALLDKNPNCASDDQVADFLVPYTRLFHLNAQINAGLDVIERLLSRVDQLGDDQRVVLIRHVYVALLILKTRYRDAAAIQGDLSSRCQRLGDSRSKAYGFQAEIWASTVIAPKPLNEFLKLKREAIRAASDAADPYILKWTWWAIGFEELHRGLMMQARDSAHEVMRVGQFFNDPQSTGVGLWLLTFIALFSDSYNEALEYSERCLAVAITPLDRIIAKAGRAPALVVLRRLDEAVPLLEEGRRLSSSNGFLQHVKGAEPFWALCKVFQWKISEGICLFEDTISRHEKEGYRTWADWCRLYLCEVYIQMIAGSEKPPFATLLRNLPIILKVNGYSPSRIRSLTTHVMDNPHLDSSGHHVGRAQMILGLLYKIKRKRALAIQHLTEAKRILSPFGPTPILTRVETALAELGH
jgi:class 3 adenylate cyclase